MNLNMNMAFWKNVWLDFRHSKVGISNIEINGALFYRIIPPWGEMDWDFNISNHKYCSNSIPILYIFRSPGLNKQFWLFACLKFQMWIISSLFRKTNSKKANILSPFYLICLLNFMVGDFKCLVYFQFFSNYFLRWE